MIDAVYVLVTAAFFASMLGYVAACDRLGSAGDGDESREGAP